MSVKEETMCAIANRRRLRRLTLRFVAVIALAVAGIVATQATLAKANYPVRQCLVRETPAFDASLGGNDGAIGAGDECTGGRLYGLTFQAPNAGQWGGSFRQFTWTAPGGTVFREARIGRIHYGTDSGWGPLYVGENTWSSLPCGGGSNVFCSEGLVQTNTHWMGIAMYCWRPGNQQCVSNWAYVWVDGSVVFDVQDDVDPTINATGHLLEGGVVSGVENLSVTATDVGGGVGSAAVYVNGTPSEGVDLCNDTRDSGGYLHRLKPCPDNPGTQTLSVDTQNDPGWANGPNDVRICALDVSGRSRCMEQSVFVDNSCPSSGGEAAASLSSGADVGGSLRRQASVRSTDEPVIRGTLKGTTGNPISQATICVYETVQLEDSSTELARKVTTQDNGRFALRLDAGASRKVDLLYRYNNKLLSDSVQLDSTVVPTLRVAKKKLVNGKPVRFVGTLPGPKAGGRSVALQARAGKKWRTFKQLQTDAQGKFRGLYRFLHTAGLQRYLFRAVVKRQSGYPYEPGASPKRKVTVRG